MWKVWLGLAAGVVAAAAGMAPRVATAQPSIHPFVETGAHMGAITVMATDRDETVLVTASADRTIRVWDLPGGSLRRVIHAPTLSNQSGPVTAMDVSPDGRRIVVATADRPVAQKASSALYAIDLRTGQVIGSRSTAFGAIQHLRFNRRGDRLVVWPGLVSDAPLRLVDAATFDELVSTPLPCGIITPWGADVSTDDLVAAECNGNLMLFAPDGRLAASTPLRQRSSVPRGGIRFSPDGRWLAVISQPPPPGFINPGQATGATLTLYAIPDLSVARTLDSQGMRDDELQLVGWSGDGSNVYATGAEDAQGIASVWSWSMARHGPPTRILPMAPAASVLLGLRGGFLAAGTVDGGWGVWNAATGRDRSLSAPAVVIHRWDTSRLSVSGLGLDLQFGDDAVSGIWSFDLAMGELRRGEHGPVMAPKQDNTRVVTTDRDISWDGTRLLFGFFQATRPTSARSYALAHDGRQLAVGTPTGLATYSRADGPPRWRSFAPGGVHLVNWSANGRVIVAGCGDGAVRWYDAETGKELLALLVNRANGDWVAFTPEGFFHSSPRGRALLRYRISQAPEREDRVIDAEQLSERYFRPGLLTARLLGQENLVSEAVAQLGDARAVLGSVPPPRLRLLSAPEVESDGRYVLELEATPGQAGAAIGRLQLRINGADSDGDARALVPPGGGRVTQRLDLAAGTNTISVRVESADGRVRSDEVVAVVRVRHAADRPALRVLAVGISEYLDSAFKRGVRFAANDARAVADQFSRGASDLYSNVDIKVLNQREQTTLARIDAELTALVERARPDDAVVIFLAGHGRAINDTYHYVPSDFRYDSDSAFRTGRSLSQERLLELMRKLRSQKVLVILDTCDSGSFRLAGRGGAGMQKAGIESLMRQTGRVVLAAASEQGRALEDGYLGHGLFSLALLEGLSGRVPPTAAGLVPVSGLQTFIRSRVEELSRSISGGELQVPMANADRDAGLALVRPAPRK